MLIDWFCSFIVMFDMWDKNLYNIRNDIIKLKDVRFFNIVMVLFLFFGFYIVF